jgi:hypothetical protein
MFLIVSKYLLPKGFTGLTVFPFVILREKKHADDAVTVNHEYIHIRQQVELLVVFFFVWYLVEFGFRMIQFRNKDKAYRNISFEREAYQNEKDPGYLKRRSFWKFLKFV